MGVISEVTLRQLLSSQTEQSNTKTMPGLSPFAQTHHRAASNWQVIEQDGTQNPSSKKSKVLTRCSAKQNCEVFKDGSDRTLRQR
jgi:hypothetical protein